MNEYLLIGEMAKIHDVTRQTLIFYDKIGLFKPCMIDNKSRRMYKVEQIPYLREICFLKSIGVSLEEIKKHLPARNPQNAISLLELHYNQMDESIRELIKKENYIKQRIDIYKSAIKNKQSQHSISIRHFEERRIACSAFQGSLNRQIMHLTMMNAREKLSRNGILISNGFGTLLCRENVIAGKPFEKGYVYVNLPTEDTGCVEDVQILPAGDYACSEKYGMPYEVEYDYDLLNWIEKNNYIAIGDIIDTCLLDATFYEKGVFQDFCEVQIQVKSCKL